MTILEQPTSEVDEWTQFEILSDTILAKIQKSTAPLELKQMWTTVIEDAEDLLDLKNHVKTIEIKIHQRSINDNKKFKTPPEDKLFIDANITKEKIATVVKGALAGEYEQAGEGMTAEVYTSNKYPDVCYKIITHPVEYKKSLNVKEEMSMQDHITPLEVNGVRVPKPYSYNMNENIHLCVMEKFNAATLQDILMGKEELPIDFDIDQKFSDLKKFFSIMHDKYGIYHRDFHDKNIMFDLEDGTIRVIDFGKAVKRFGTEDDIYREADGTVYPLTDEQQIDKHQATLKKYLRLRDSLALDK